MYQAEVGSNIAQKCENFTKSEIYSNIAQNHFDSWKTIYMYTISYICFM